MLNGSRSNSLPFVYSLFYSLASRASSRISVYLEWRYRRLKKKRNKNKIDFWPPPPCCQRESSTRRGWGRITNGVGVCVREGRRSSQMLRISPSRLYSPPLLNSSIYRCWWLHSMGGWRRRSSTVRRGERRTFWVCHPKSIGWWTRGIQRCVCHRPSFSNNVQLCFKYLKQLQAGQLFTGVSIWSYPA